jgi:hypothetical protein
MGSTTPTDSGVTGQVHLGPQCPVENPGKQCEDKPAANVAVTVAMRMPTSSGPSGAVVARATTDARGTYRIAVAPGAYVVTADAGMSCAPTDARVREHAYSTVDISCDTGIR